MAVGKLFAVGLLFAGGLGSFAAVAQTLPNSPAGDKLVEPPDSTPRYFPAQAAQDYKRGRPDDTTAQVLCQYTFRYVSQCLAAFKAPVLASAYQGPAVYRFVWLRSFHRPALLTLERTKSGGMLKTQFLNKPPGLSVPQLLDPAEPGITGAVRKELWELSRALATDKQWQASVAFAKALVVMLEEQTVTLSAAQWQQFDQLLAQAGFWQLPSCGADLVTDGAYWLLEVRDAARYHLVFRHSPAKKEPFRQCCEFLLNLSPARRERRY